MPFLLINNNMSTNIQKNFATASNFVFYLTDMPNTEFFCDNVTIPSVDLPKVEVPNPILELPVPGDHINYDDLVIEFKINEDWSNYIELLEWTQGLGFDKKNKQYKDLKNSSTIQRPKNLLYSNAKLVALTNANNPNVEFNFSGVFPTNISQISMNYDDDSKIPLKCTASFAFYKFEVNSI